MTHGLEMAVSDSAKTRPLVIRSYSPRRAARESLAIARAVSED